MPVELTSVSVMIHCFNFRIPVWFVYTNADITGIIEMIARENDIGTEYLVRVRTSCGRLHTCRLQFEPTIINDVLCGGHRIQD